MLRFSAPHAIKPMTKIYTMKEVDEVIDRLKRNRVRYPAVLVNETRHVRRRVIAVRRPGAR